MASRITQAERNMVVSQPATATSARVTQAERNVVVSQGANLTDARVTQIERSIIAEHIPNVVPIFPVTASAVATFPPVTVTVETTPVAENPPPGGGIVTAPPPKSKDKSKDKQDRDKGRPSTSDPAPTPAPSPTPSPSTPPAAIGPGGGEGIGGSGIGVGAGIGSGIGPGASPPGETPVAILPVDPSFIPRVNVPDTVPPLQIIPRSAISPELGRLPMPSALPVNDHDRALYRQTAQWQQFTEDRRGRSVLGVNRGLSGMDGADGMSGLGASNQTGWNQTRSLETYRRGSRGLEREFFERGSVTTPGPGVDVIVVDWTVPTGYEARLYAYYCLYTGLNFVQGSGDIIWGLRAGLNWVRNLGGLLYSVGSLTNPFPIQDYVTVASNQRVVFQVNVPNISGGIQVGASRILCGLQGWLLPVTRRAEDHGR